MRIRHSGLLLASLIGASVSTSAVAQNKCTNGSPPAGTYAACGYAPGYYRPQPYTLTRDGRPVRARNSWYAPTGRNQRDWNQYDGDRNTYGPREPNPYNERGRLSPGRTARHLYQTRVRPWVERRRRGR